MNLQYLKGIGETRAKLLAKELDIHTVEDLLNYFPYKYVDKSQIYKIDDFVENGSFVQVRGKFLRFTEEGVGRKKRLIALFSDGKSSMEVLWFSNTSYFRKQFENSNDYLLFGKPSLFNGRWSMIHPEIELYNPEKPPMGNMGIYSLTEGLRKKNFSSRFFRSVIKNAFENKFIEKLPESLPIEILNYYHLMDRKEAYLQLHFPSDPLKLRKARERMKFEELYYLELNILRFSRERKEKTKGFIFPQVGEYFNRFYKEYLPFTLTEAQKRVIREIRRDMKSGHQMNRLLQGDVGSGKTMVAFLSMLIAVDNGYQAALMAPTEILALQHYDTIRKWGTAIGVSVRLLTGNVKGKERKNVFEGINNGSIDILIGTHALIEDDVIFKNLGMAVVDEQHRFGVAQRARLWNKGDTAPHMLVMTATPIPRTLAMTVYGDLDVSVIDELPPGRVPIDTRLFSEEDRNMVYRLVNQQIKEGRQAYIVYPLIHENEKLDLKSLESGLERIRGIFEGIPVSYVHGKMKPEEKDLQMSRFVSGKTKIMVATTVIEVGVNVPNATVMIIENAERFGLSQLHQLRGRVGRGAERSFCFLMGKESGSRETKKRLGIMTETTDGFLISEADMKLRGPGDIEGTMQSGLPFKLKIANLVSDGQILSLARTAAEQTLDSFPSLYNENVKTKCNGTDSNHDSIALSILTRELDSRFAHMINWSKIS